MSNSSSSRNPRQAGTSQTGPAHVGGFVPQRGKPACRLVSIGPRPQKGSCVEAQASRRRIVERADQLVANPEYPSDAELQKIALLLADHFLAEAGLN